VKQNAAALMHVRDRALAASLSAIHGPM